MIPRRGSRIIGAAPAPEGVDAACRMDPVAATVPALGPSVVTAEPPTTDPINGPTNGHSYRTLNVLGVATDVLLSAHQTHGACSVFRITIPANYANPPHVHWFEDETFYVLDGELEVTVGSIPTIVQAGQAAFGPRRVLHSFANKTDSPVVAIVHASPGGLERFFEACDTAFPEGTPIDPVQLVGLIERHGMSIV